MPPRAERAAHGEEGTASVELVAVVPFLLLAIVAAAQIALAGQALWSAGGAARGGGRAACGGGGWRRERGRGRPWLEETRQRPLAPRSRLRCVRRRRWRTGTGFRCRSR